MGCGAGTAKDEHPTTQRRRPDEPELAGKQKFVSCPSIAFVTHPLTKQRWMLMVFNPLTHRGLTFVARALSEGSILTREVQDSELIKEKDQYGIKPSWNIFFKCIATEIMKAANENSGAKLEFTAEGTLKMEIKIAIVGAATKPDIYPVELHPVESSEETLYRLIIEPTATFFHKKNTDFIDRPDPVRERQLGEVEVNYIRHSASIAASQVRIADAFSRLTSLRKQATELEKEAFEKRARLEMLRMMAIERTTRPSYVSPNSFCSVECLSGRKSVCCQTVLAKELVRGSSVTLHSLAHLEPRMYRGAREASSGNSSNNSGGGSSIALQTRDAVVLPQIEVIEKVFESGNVPPLAIGQATTAKDGVSGAAGPLWGHLLAFDAPDHRAFSGLELQAASGGYAMYLCGLYAFYRWGLVGSGANSATPAISPNELKNYLFVLAQLAGASNPFHNSVKSCETLHLLHWMLRHGELAAKLQLVREDILALLLAALILGVDHPGAEDEHIIAANSFLTTTYCHRAPLEKHSLTVAWELAQTPSCLMPWKEMMLAVSHLVISTNYQRHSEFMFEYERRSNSTRQMGRIRLDRLLAMSLMLKLADNFHFVHSAKQFAEWDRRRAEEKKRSNASAAEASGSGGMQNWSMNSSHNIFLDLDPMTMAAGPMIEAVQALSPSTLHHLATAFAQRK